MNSVNYCALLLKLVVSVWGGGGGNCDYSPLEPKSLATLLVKIPHFMTLQLFFICQDNDLKHTLQCRP
jgi:hypothetical protein